MPVEPSLEALQAAYAAAGLTPTGEFPTDHPAVEPATPPASQVQSVTEHPSSQLDSQGRQTVLGVMKEPGFTDDQMTEIGQAIIDARRQNAIAAGATPEQLKQIEAEAVAEVEAALHADGYSPPPDDPRSNEAREFDAAMGPPADPSEYAFDWTGVELPPDELADMDAGFRELATAVGLPAQQGAVFTNMVTEALDFEALDDASRQSYLHQQHDILLRMCGGLEGARAAFAKGYNLLVAVAPDMVKELEARGSFRSANTVMALAHLADARTYRASLDK